MDEVGRQRILHALLVRVEARTTELNRWVAQIMRPEDSNVVDLRRVRRSSQVLAVVWALLLSLQGWRWALQVSCQCHNGENNNTGSDKLQHAT